MGAEWERQLERRKDVQARWEKRRRVRLKGELRRRVNEQMESIWVKVRELAQKAAAAGTMEAELVALTAEANARQMERGLMDTGYATIEDGLRSLIETVERCEWVRCPKCREEYSKLRESGLCIDCDPYTKPAVKGKERPEDLVEEFDHMVRAAGQ